MKITGTLTDFGRRLVSDQVLNGHSYTVHSIVAGSGDTPLSSNYLHDQKQTLAITSEVVGGVSVYTATLSMAAATENYTLTELGINAYYSASGLFKLYKLSKPVEVDNSQDHTIRFTFRDEDVEKALYDGYVMPDTVVTYDILMGNLGAEHEHPSETVSYSCTRSELHGVLASIPQRLDKHYVINLSESAVGSFVIEGKYGKGSITIKGRGGQSDVAAFTRVEGVAAVRDCDAAVILEDLRLICRSGDVSSLDITRCKDVKVVRCETGALGEDGYIVRCRQSGVKLINCPVSESKGSGALLFEGSHAVMDYNAPSVFDRSFMPGGAAFFTLRDYSDMVCMGGLTETAMTGVVWRMDRAVRVMKDAGGNVAVTMG